MASSLSTHRGEMRKRSPRLRLRQTCSKTTAVVHSNFTGATSEGLPSRRIITLLYPCTHSSKQVLVALLVGIWAGALLVSGFNPLSAFLRTFDTYFVGAFVAEGNAEVLLFTFLLGGTIGLVQRSGGALGLANALKGFMGKKEQAVFVPMSMPYDMITIYLPHGLVSRVMTSFHSRTRLWCVGRGVSRLS